MNLLVGKKNDQNVVQDRSLHADINILLTIGLSNIKGGCLLTCKGFAHPT